MNPPALRILNTSAERRPFLVDVLEGLSAEQKRIPSKYFYDETGSRIFDEITELPEYYPTRTEAAIMRQYGSEMASKLGANVRLVEYGSGSSVKTRILLDNLHNVASYVPVDISGDYLEQVAESLRSDYPHISIEPVTADFSMPFTLPSDAPLGARTVAYFPGSTIGNFTADEAHAILSQMSNLCGSDGAVLIGVDLLKPVELLIAAYNDRQGVTAQFNLNLLHRLNRELDANFVTGRFRHEALFNEDESRIEMHLISTHEQTVCIRGNYFDFETGETILTEYSHKYTLESFAELAANAGLQQETVWTDTENLFSVQHLVPIR